MSEEYLLAELKEKMNELGIHPQKHLGQNFLIHQYSIDRILQLVKNKNAVQWVEIGPGLGALTETLYKEHPSLIVIELDRKMFEYWKSRGVHAIHQDALQLDWQGLKLPKSSGLISNLPYQIAASLVIELSVQDCGIDFMILMFQKEVAQRICAKSSSENYGLLSVIAQNFWDVKFDFEISSKDFFPPPKVASRILSFTRKSQRFEEPQLFLKLVKAGFAMRRKLLWRNLQVGLNEVQSEKMRVMMEKNNWLKARAEELTPIDWLHLHQSWLEAKL